MKLGPGGRGFCVECMTVNTSNAAQSAVLPKESTASSFRALMQSCMPQCSCCVSSNVRPVMGPADRVISRESRVSLEEPSGPSVSWACTVTEPGCPARVTVYAHTSPCMEVVYRCASYIGRIACLTPLLLTCIAVLPKNASGEQAKQSCDLPAISLELV